MTWFAKIRNNPARTEIQIMAWHESHTPALSRHTNGRATNSQVCFHRHHFCDPVNSWQSTMECVVPLGRTNQGHTWYETAVSDRTGLAGKLWLSVHFNEHTMAVFCSNVWKNPPTAPHPPPPPIPPPSCPPTPYILNPWYWWGLKKVSEIPAPLVS